MSYLDEVLSNTIAEFRTDSGTIHLLAEDGLLHLKAASAGIPPVVLEKVRAIPVGKGMAGLAVERRAPINVCNLQTDTSGDIPSGAKATGMEGAIVVPILRGEEAIGALGVANRGERTFTDGEIARLIEIGRRIAEAPEG